VLSHSQNPQSLTNEQAADSSRFVRIAGFGACMISGYPHEGAGLFEVACETVEEALSHPVQSHLVSLGGFPAPRAAKHFRHKVTGFQPDYVVIQLGATDAQCPIRARNRQAKLTSKASVYLKDARKHARAATAQSRIRWELSSLIGYVWRLKPVTPLSTYLEAIERLADECLSTGIRPIILSPFIFGSGYTTRYSARYTAALQELQSRMPDLTVINCVELLSPFPKSRILMDDGFHLSSFAHRLIGAAAGKAIADDFKARDIRDSQRTASHGRQALILTSR
jgi:hypothetical protein